jgi:hypothetical protein
MVVLRIWVLHVLLSPTLLCAFFVDLYCKGKRLQIVEIPRNQEKYWKGNVPWAISKYFGDLVSNTSA